VARRGVVADRDATGRPEFVAGEILD